jgi:hypothetical protein
MISATQKWKRDDTDILSLATDTKTKISPIFEYFAVQENRIWETNSDKDENC